MIGILIAVVVAALVYMICVALGLPAIVGIIAAILVLLAGIPSAGFGFGRRLLTDAGPDRPVGNREAAAPGEGSRARFFRVARCSRSSSTSVRRRPARCASTVMPISIPKPGAKGVTACGRRGAQVALPGDRRARLESREAPDRPARRTRARRRSRRRRGARRRRRRGRPCRRGPPARPPRRRGRRREHEVGQRAVRSQALDREVRHAALPEPRGRAHQLGALLERDVRRRVGRRVVGHHDARVRERRP